MKWICLFFTIIAMHVNVNLPLHIIPSTKKSNLPLVFMISGDGGWTSFDQSLAETLASKGLPVIGLDAQKYFWKKKTPDGTAADLAKAIVHYSSAMGKHGFVLAGYSFGASIVPFVARRLSPALKAKLKGIISLSPDVSTDFEIRIADILHLCEPNKYNVLTEFKMIKALPSVCYFGTDEQEKIRRAFSKNGIKVGLIPGNHHFNHNFPEIVRTVLKEIKPRL